CGEAGIVLPALRGHALDRGFRVFPCNAAHRQLGRQLLARMFAPHQQAQRTLGRGGLRPASPAPVFISRRTRRRLAAAIVREHEPAQALASSSSTFSTTAGASCSRSAASIFAATAGLSLRYWRAFSLPWP